MSEKLEIEIHDKISEIVISHKRGELSYNAGLEILEKMGLKQIDAHHLLFPPISDDDFNPDLPFDPTDFMQMKLKEGEE